jgi:molybdate transport system substrate-binding protein
LLATGLASTTLRAEELTIAVAANFLPTLRALVPVFEESTGHEAVLVSGSSGQLYAQIVNGAPFDVLLAADAERPRLLAESGFGQSSSVFTYAVGQLALWSAEADRVSDDTLGALADVPLRWFAIAEPKVAPYGEAARQVLENLGVWQRLEPKLVRGQNVAQAFAMVETRNADLGLVALSQALAYGGTASYRTVPADLHEPIRQDAILLKRGEENPAALGFVAFLRSAAAAEIIVRYGYAVPADK